MARKDEPRLSMFSIYASGLKKWLARKSWLSENFLLIVLVSTFAACLLALLLLHKYAHQLDPLALDLLEESVKAILIADTVGLFYELVARKSMAQETLKLVRKHLKRDDKSIRELAALFKGKQQAGDCGLIDCGITRQFLHHDIKKHLPSLESARIMVIHGTRLWVNNEIHSAIVNSRKAKVRVLLLSPDSGHVDRRTNEHPDEYDHAAMRSQIISAIRLLDKWKERKGGDCQVRLYDQPPSFWLVFLDDVLYLSGYHRGRGSQDSEVFKFDNRKHSMYHIFDEYFERAWAEAAEASEVEDAAPRRPARQDVPQA